MKKRYVIIIYILFFNIIVLYASTILINNFINAFEIAYMRLFIYHTIMLPQYHDVLLTRSLIIYLAGAFHIIILFYSLDKIFDKKYVNDKIYKKGRAYFISNIIILSFFFLYLNNFIDAFGEIYKRFNIYHTITIQYYHNIIFYRIFVIYLIGISHVLLILYISKYISEEKSTK